MDDTEKKQPAQKADLLKMDQEQMQAVLDFLREKWKNNQKCEVCNTNNWTVADHLVVPLIFKSGPHFTGPAYPQVIAICTNCGNTKYFNAVLSKVVKRPEDPKNEAPNAPIEEKKEGQNG